MTELEEINIEISEYEEMITHSIQINDKERLKMWRKLYKLQKSIKGDLLTHNVVMMASCDN